MFFFLIRLALFLWGIGLIGAGVMVKNPELCAASSRSVLGVNLIQIGILLALLMWGWHYFAKAPPGSTFWQKVIFALQQMLSWPKKIINAFITFWQGVPVS